MRRLRPSLPAAALAFALAGCSLYGDTDGETYRISSASGSLASWEQTTACSCTLDKEQIQFGCQRAEDDPVVSFFAPLVQANLRTRGFVQMYVTRPSLTFDASANARAELELQSEDIVFEVEGSSGSHYRALIVHQLYFPAKRLCDITDPSVCIEIGEGRLTDARFLCSDLR